MRIQSRLIFAVFLLTLVVPVWASGVSVVYPNSYHKRTTYYDSLAAQIKAELGTNVSNALPGQVPQGHRIIALGGTELFLHGQQGPQLPSEQQFAELRKLFPSLTQLHALFTKAEQTQFDKVKAVATSAGFKNINGSAKSSQKALVDQFASLLNSIDDKAAIWLPKSLLSAVEGSAFRQMLSVAWEKQQGLVAPDFPDLADGFVFFLMTNNQSFPAKLSKALKNTDKDTFIMVPPKKPQTLTVIYPKVKVPNDAVFNQIIEGIEQQFNGSVNLVSIERGADLPAIAASIDRDKPDMVISLSRTGKKVAELMKVKTPKVAGATQLLPKDGSGISPGGAPSLMLQYINDLAPEIKRVHVVYSARSRWLVELAEQSAAQTGLTLAKYSVKNRKQAIVKYTELFKSSNYKTDAFWLPYDSVTASNKYILPLVLDASWDKRFVVVSSIPPHAKRGALLSLYPDNMTTGVELVKLVEEMYTHSSEGRVIPTSKVLLAVNLRTASHLGLQYTTKQKGQFDLTFPSR